jgi:hypothetical protein
MKVNVSMVFKFRESAGLAGDPQKVGETLHKIRERNGTLTPMNVVDSARSAKSPLHRYFEWDDKKAAEEHRKGQARYLIACVVTVETDGDEITPVRSFVSINNSYEPVEVVMSDAVMRQQALLDVKDAINSLKSKLAAFEEFADVLSALDRVSKVVSKHHRQTGSRATVR